LYMCENLYEKIRWCETRKKSNSKIVEHHKVYF